MYVILDTNVIFGDFRMKGSVFKDLFEYLETTDSILTLPRVVSEELVAKYGQSAAELKTACDRLWSKACKLGCESSLKLAFGDTELKQATEEYEKWLREDFSSRKYVQSADYDKFSMNDLVGRVVNHRKPSKSSGVGVADTLIWYSVLTSVRTEGDTILITNNTKDFCNQEKSALHCDLLQEVDDAIFTLKWFPSIPAFLESTLPEIDGIDLSWFLLHEDCPEISQNVIGRALGSVLEVDIPLIRHIGKEFLDEASAIQATPVNLYSKRITKKKVAISVHYSVEVDASVQLQGNAESDDSQRGQYHPIHVIYDATAELVLEFDKLKQERIDFGEPKVRLR